MRTFTCIWESTVRPDRFAPLRSAMDPHRLVTADRWRSREACPPLRDRHRTEYDMLDTRCGAFILAERHIGDFEPLD